MHSMNWRKTSSSSGNGGECGEVASPDSVAVRDTKQDDTGPRSGSPRPHGAGSPTR